MEYSLVVNPNLWKEKNLDADEVFLALVLASKMNKDRFSFPRNKELTEELGCGIDKLQRLKKQLIDKGIIVVDRRFTDNGNGQGSNIYTIVSNDIKLTSSPVQKQLSAGGGQKTIALDRKLNPPPLLHSEIPRDLAYYIDKTSVAQHASKVDWSNFMFRNYWEDDDVQDGDYSEDDIDNEKIEQVESHIKKNLIAPYKVATRKSEIFDDLIRTFWDHLSRYKSYYLNVIAESFNPYPNRKRIKGEDFCPSWEDEDDFFFDSSSLDATTKSFLDRVAASADKLYDIFFNLRRPELIYLQVPSLIRADKDKASDKPSFPYSGKDIVKEYRYQVNAYHDFCRLSKRMMITTPESIPEKLIEQDWPFVLYNYVKDHIKNDKYDPAADEDLLSDWLIWLNYWSAGEDEVYICKRYNNRIVYNGIEYLRSKNPLPTSIDQPVTASASVLNKRSN